MANKHNHSKIKALKVVLAKEKGYTKRSWFISNLYEAYRSYESMVEHILNNPEWEPNILEADFREIY